MKKKFIFAAMTALAMTAGMSSCSNDNEPAGGFGETKNEEGFLFFFFNAQPNNNAMGSVTKATPVTSSNFYNSTLVPNMKVWGFFGKDVTEGNGITQGGQYVGANGDGIVIDNKSTESPLVSKWDYNNDADRGYWPKEALNFQAIIPASDGSFRVAATVGANKLAHTVAEVTVPTDQSQQKDIMFAQVKEQTRTADANTPVTFTFDHALSQIVFQGKTYADKISVDVESITIANADQKGKVGYLTDDDTDVVLGAQLADDRAYAKYAIGMAADATLNNTNMASAKNLTADDGALIMMPQNRTGEKWSTTASVNVAITAADAANETYLAISCKVKNDNVFLIGGESTYETVYIPFEINWEQGKKYTYTLIFGKGTGGFDENGKPLDSMLPITYTVESVNNWTPADGGNVEF